MSSPLSATTRLLDAIDLARDDVSDASRCGSDGRIRTVGNFLHDEEAARGQLDAHLALLVDAAAGSVQIRDLNVNVPDSGRKACQCESDVAVNVCG